MGNEQRLWLRDVTDAGRDQSLVTNTLRSSCRRLLGVTSPCPRLSPWPRLKLQLPTVGGTCRRRAVADSAAGRARPPTSPQPLAPPAGGLFADVGYAYVLAEFPVPAAQEVWEVVNL